MSNASTSAELLDQAAAVAKAKNWEGAAQVLAEAGDNPEILDKRAFYLSRAKRYNEAIEIFEELHKRFPRSSRYCYMVGFQYSQQESWLQAIEWYQASISLDPNYIKAHYRLAQAYHRTEKKIPAQLSAMRVLRLWNGAGEELKEREKVKFARACYLLAKLQLRSDPEGAVSLLRQAAEQEPDDPYKPYLLGKALNRCGQGEEALRHLQRAKQGLPRKTFVDIEIARSLVAGGQVEQARSEIKRIARFCKGWEAYSAAGLASEVGEPEIARRLLKSAERKGPTKNSRAVKERLQALPAPTVDRQEPAYADDGETESRGKVVHLNPKRNFGFLVDEQGIKRHFRVKDRSDLEKGKRVTFKAAMHEKGPTAQDVRIAAQ